MPWMIISGTLFKPLAVLCQPSTTVLRNASLLGQQLCSDSDLTRSGYLPAKWLKANHARAPIWTGAVTRTRQPVDVERHASRVNELSKRAKNL